ncbi:hypothetical protein BLOT_000521 [Blomia tropicalis]|nr:hypothetical protein BLOT_000521 [Blomia tropicalis]
MATSILMITLIVVFILLTTPLETRSLPLDDYFINLEDHYCDKYNDNNKNLLIVDMCIEFDSCLHRFLQETKAGEINQLPYYNEAFECVMSKRYDPKFKYRKK